MALPAHCTQPAQSLTRNLTPTLRTPQQHPRITLLGAALLLAISGAEGLSFSPATTAELQGALNDYCADATAAEATHGAIGTWQVGAVTNMENLIGGISCKSTFNADISGWDVSSVTNMVYMVRTAHSCADRP